MASGERKSPGAPPPNCHGIRLALADGVDVQAVESRRQLSGAGGLHCDGGEATVEFDGGRGDPLPLASFN